MDQLSDELLMEAYEKAKRLKLSDDFVALIEKELKKRAIPMGNTVQQKTYV